MGTVKNVCDTIVKARLHLDMFKVKIKHMQFLIFLYTLCSRENQKSLKKSVNLFGVGLCNRLHIM